MAPTAATAKGRRVRPRSNTPRAAANPSPVRLVLRTAKQTYRVGEPLEITGYLENRSEQSYYVGNVLITFLGGASLHRMELRVYDNRGREVDIGRGRGDWIWERGTPVEKKLALAYTQLRAGTLFGQTASLALPLRAGRYRLVATYREIEALSWTDAERKALPVPVWTEPLTSNAINITVVP